MKHNSILLCLLFIVIVNSFTIAKAQAVNVNDSLALVDLYNSTDGPHWSFHANWLAGPVNTWSGISVTGTRVTGIDLYGKNLNGRLPASIGNLTALVTMYMGSNLLQDTLPASMGNLTMLRVMDFYNNQLRGILPAFVTNLTNLTNLNLSFNRFKGRIPPAIGNLVNLSFLSLAHNELGGIIPASVGRLANLTTLYLNTNNLTGSIPATISKLVNLKELVLSENNLTGSIPPEIGRLTNLISLTLTNNQLSGEIPYSIGNLTQLLSIYLNVNQLSGSIPASIGKDTSLRYFDFSSNQLSGSIPYALGNLPYLSSIYLADNQLSGSIPTSLAKSTSLTSLSVNNNALSGAIPSFINCKNLGILNLSDNQFTQSNNVNFLQITKASARIFLSYNQFTFNGLEVIASKYKSASYAPQALISIHRAGNALSVSAGGTLSNNTYKWFKVGDASFTTITGDSTFTPLSKGKYYAKVTNAVATQLTLTTDTVTYTVPLARISFSSSAVMANNAITHFSVYPNPVKDILHLQTNGTAIITLINSAGKVMLSKSMSNSGEINVSAFANGIYYIKNKITGEVQKVIIIH